MTGPQQLTIAIIIVFVIAFIITMIMLNSYVKNMLSSKKLFKNG